MEWKLPNFSDEYNYNKKKSDGNNKNQRIWNIFDDTLFITSQSIFLIKLYLDNIQTFMLLVPMNDLQTIIPYLVNSFNGVPFLSEKVY